MGSSCKIRGAVVQSMTSQICIMSIQLFILVYCLISSNAHGVIWQFIVSSIDSRFCNYPLIRRRQFIIPVDTSLSPSRGILLDPVYMLSSLCKRENVQKCLHLFFNVLCYYNKFETFYTLFHHLFTNEAKRKSMHMYGF